MLPLWGCGCRVWWRWLRMRCRDALVVVPGWCGCGGFLVFACGVVRWDCVCACMCAPGFANGVWRCVRVARLVSGGVFYYARRGVLARPFVCRLRHAPSRVAGLLRFVFCRLLYGVRFVSAPAPTVTWFMQVCAGARLTAAVVVAYCLLCKGALPVVCAVHKCARRFRECFPPS